MRHGCKYLQLMKIRSGRCGFDAVKKEGGDFEGKDLRADVFMKTGTSIASCFGRQIYW